MSLFNPEVPSSVFEEGWDSPHLSAPTPWPLLGLPVMVSVGDQAEPEAATGLRMKAIQANLDVLPCRASPTVPVGTSNWGEVLFARFQGDGSPGPAPPPDS